MVWVQRRDSMKDMIKSKGLVIFVILFLGIIVVDSSINVKLENKVETNKNEIVMANIK